MGVQRLELFICIAAVVALLLLFVLLTPICLTVIYDGDIAITLSYLFFRKPLYPSEKRLRLSDYSPRKLRKRRKKAKKKKLMQRQKEALKKKGQKKEKQPLLAQLRAIRLLLHILKRIYKGVLSSVRVRIKRFYVSVAADDAAKTAILYGIVSQGAAYILELISTVAKTRVQRDAIRIYPDFTASESTLSLHVRFSMPLYKVLLYALKSGMITLTYENNKKKNTKKNNTPDTTHKTNHGGNQHE